MHPGVGYGRFRSLGQNSVRGTLFNLSFEGIM